MRDKVKRFISILMTALMLVNLLPVGALAEGVTATTTVISNVTQSAALTTSEKVDNKNIYVYVQIVGANETQQKRINELLELNSSGFYTIGKKEYNENVLPGTYSKWNGYDPRLSNTTTYSENQTVQGKTLPTYTSVYRNLTDTKKENRMIPLEEVSWGVYKFTQGANGYKPSEVGAWHLDGTIGIAQINFPYQVLYIAQYPDGTEKLLGKESVTDGVLGAQTNVGPKDYAGYTPKLPIEQKTIDTDTVVRVYYTPNSYKYTVEYYYDNVKDEAKTKTIEGALCGSTINEYADELVEGYTFDHDEGLPLTISSNESDNVIRVYYKPDGSRININYSTEQGGDITEPTKDSAYTTTGQIIRNKDDDDNWVASTASVQKGKEDKFAFVGWYKVNESGNKFDRLVSADEYLTAKEIKDSLNGEQGNYRTTKYHARFAKKSDIQYTVNHFEDGTNTMIAPSETKTATPYQYAAGMISADSQQKDIEGYTYKEGKPGSIKIPIKNGQNVLDLYYTRNSYNYTVHYYWKGTTEPVADDTTGTLDAGATLDVWPKEGIKDYTPVSSKKETITEEHKDITFYYYKNVELTANSDTKTYDGNEHRVSGFTGAPEGVTFEGITEPSASGTDVGSYEANFVHDKDKPGYPLNKVDTTGKYIVTKATDGSLTISKRNVTLTSGSASKTYDGTELTNGTVTAEGFVEGQGATYNVTGSQTDVGTSNNTFSYTLNKGTNSNNYNITKAEGKLTVNPVTDEVTVTITGNTGSYTYDGDSHTVTGYDVSTSNTLYTAADFEFKGKAEVTGKDVPENPEGKYLMGLKNTDFENKSENFSNVTFVVTDGYVKITPREVTLTSADLTKVYDGTPLTNGDTPVKEEFGTEKAFPEGEGVTYDFTGSQTLVGSSENTFSYKLNEGTLARNYIITSVLGTLTVTDGTEDDPVKPENVVTKTHTPKDTGYNVGETVTFTVSVKNIYNVPKTITLTEKENVTFSNGENTIEFKDVPAGKTVTAEATYTITLDDILADGFTNEVKANFEGGKSWKAKDTVETRDPYIKLDVMKTADVDKAALGQTITYTITVDYQSNVPGKKVEVKDPLTGLETSFTTEEALEGKTVTFTTTYTVTEQDVKNGIVKNTATVKSELDNEWTSADVETQTFAPITIKPKNVTATYNGAAITGKDVEITSGELLEGHKLSAAVDGSGVNAETYELTIDRKKIKIVDENNKDVSAMYVCTVLPGTLTISKRNVTLTSETASKPYDGTALTKPVVAVTGDGFVAGEVKEIKATGSVTYVSDGKVTNTITYTEGANFKESNYNIKKDEGTLEVTKNEKVVVKVKGKTDSVTYDGNPHSVAGYEVDSIEIDGEATELYKEADFKFDGETNANGTDANTYPMGLTESQFTNTSNNFTNVTFVVTDGSLTINKREVTLTSATDSKEYDGTALTNGEVTVSGDGFANGEGATYNVTGSQTDVGSSDNEFTYVLNSNTKADNYKITESKGKLEVTAVTDKVTVTIKGGKSSVTYNGEEHTVSGYKVADISNPLYKEANFTFSGTAEAKGKNAGTYKMGLKAADFANTSNNFKNVEFVVADGQLEITKRPVMLTSADLTKVYDGTPLKNGDTPVKEEFGTEKAFPEGEGVTYTFKGSQTNAGSSKNTFTYAWNEGTNKDNYTIYQVEGDLVVTPIDGIKVTITGHKDTQTYDGKEHFVFGFDATPSNTLYNPKEDMQFNGTDVDMTAKGTDAGQYDIGLTAEHFTNKSNNFTNVTFVVTDGYVKINPRAVTLTSETAGKTYDGTALEKPVVTVGGDGFVEGQVKEIKATGSVTNAGSVANTITFTPVEEKFNEKNYNIQKTEGTLSINKRSVLITSQSATKTYDGSALTRPAVTITGDGFVPGELAKAEATGSITNVGSTPNAIQYTTTGAFNAANYSIALSVGTLTVTERPQPEPRRTFNLTISYVYQNGKRAAASYNRGGLKNGETFDITSPVIAGYTASETVVSGTIYNRDIKVTVIYTADGVNLDDYGVPLGLGNITMNVGDCFE